MRKLAVVLLLFAITAPVEAPLNTQKNTNAFSPWVTICRWDTTPACIVYQVITGMAGPAWIW